MQSKLIGSKKTSVSKHTAQKGFGYSNYRMSIPAEVVEAMQIKNKEKIKWFYVSDKLEGDSIALIILRVKNLEEVLYL